MKSVLFLSSLSTIAFAAVAVFSSSTLDFIHKNSPTSKKYLIETMGGGVAVLDYDNDGRLDIFLVNSGKLDESGKPASGFGRDLPLYSNRLYRQTQSGTFVDATVASGLAKASDSYGMGVATGDYNNDGFIDLYLTGFGPNQLYRNNGDGTFADATREAGVAGGGWSVSAAFLDYDNDGDLDLFVARYLDYSLEKNVLCGGALRVYCRPDKYGGTSNLLYRNEGNGRFLDVSGASGIAAVVGKGMGVAVNDYDDDGFPDIFVANDLIDQFLFRNKRDGTFEEVGLTAGVALSSDGKTFSGMGAAFEDFDNDGRPDVVVTNLAREKWALYRNEGDGQFAYASLTTGLAALVANNSGWGVGLHDFDNDGWKDLFAAQGHVLDNVERMDASLRYLEPPGLYRNEGGKFTKALAVASAPVAGRGAAFADINNDGAMDAVVSVLGGRPFVLKGVASGNHWLTLRLQGNESNRDGMGAKVRIGNQVAHATSSGSYLSANDPRVHFGLGKVASATVEIRWPSGKRQTLEQVAVDRTLTVKEPD